MAEREAGGQGKERPLRREHLNGDADDKKEAARGVSWWG